MLTKGIAFSFHNVFYWSHSGYLKIMQGLGNSTQLSCACSFDADNVHSTGYSARVSANHTKHTSNAPAMICLRPGKAWL